MEFENRQQINQMKYDEWSRARSIFLFFHPGPLCQHSPEEHTKPILSFPIPSLALTRQSMLTSFFYMQYKHWRPSSPFLFYLISNFAGISATFWQHTLNALLVFSTDLPFKYSRISAKSSSLISFIFLEVLSSFLISVRLVRWCFLFCWPPHN